jgi:hypothetical protein
MCLIKTKRGNSAQNVAGTVQTAITDESTMSLDFCNAGRQICRTRQGNISPASVKDAAGEEYVLRNLISALKRQFDLSRQKLKESILPKRV